MYQFLFKNRWFAAGFAAAILLSVYVMFGTGNGDLLADAGSNLEEQSEELESQIAELEAPQVMMDEIDFADDMYLDDHELIDSATGMDPTPDFSDDGDFGGAEPMEVQEYVNGIPVIMNHRGNNDGLD